MHDFSKCFIDISLPPKGVNLVDFFDELASFDEFKIATNDEIKIAICTSDIESPFLKTKDRTAMLTAVFAFLDIELPENTEFFNEVLEYKNKKVLDCLSRYLQILHDIDWTEWVSTKQTHDVLTFESNRPKEEGENIDNYVKRKVNIQNHLKKIGQDLKLIEAKIFPDSKAAREVSLNETRRIKTYAERFAQPRSVI